MNNNTKQAKKVLWIIVVLLAFPAAYFLVLWGFLKAGCHGFKIHWRNHKSSVQFVTFRDTYFRLHPIRYFKNDEWWWPKEHKNDHKSKPAQEKEGSTKPRVRLWRGRYLWLYMGTIGYGLTIDEAIADMKALHRKTIRDGFFAKLWPFRGKVE